MPITHALASVATQRCVKSVRRGFFVSIAGEKRQTAVIIPRFQAAPGRFVDLMGQIEQLVLIRQ